MPIRIKNILLAYDGFDRREGLSTQAISLAEEHHAQLHIVHVAASPPRRLWKLKNISADALYRALIDTRRERLEYLAKGARKWGINTRSVIRTGDPQEEIIREAISVNADLVIVSDRSSHEGHRGFRSVAANLLRGCPCPVLASCDNARRTHQRILAAVKISDANGEQPHLNRRVIETAAALAKPAGSKVIVFHSWSMWGEFILRSSEATNEEEIQDLLFAERQYRLQQLGLLIGSCDLEGVNAEIEVQKGRVTELLPRFVTQHDIDLVVMGTASRTGIQRVRIGHTAEKLINELTCSLVAVKPESFVPAISPAPEDDAASLGKADGR